MEKYYKKYIEHEYNGDFNSPVINESYFKYDKIEADYNFEEFKKSKKRIKFAKILLSSFSFFTKIFYKNKVLGKNNLKKLNGQSFLTLSNHVLYLDNVILRRALKGKNFNIVVAEVNNIKGLLGKYFRCAGTIPIPSNVKAFFNFRKYIKKLLEDNNNCLHFFAEKELWPRYNKPRPFLDGVFAFSYDLKKPILPIFIDVETTKNYRFVKSVTTHIMEPIYPNLEKKKAECIEDIKNNIEKQYAELYYKINKLSENQTLYNISKEGYKKLENHKEFQKRCLVAL